MKFRLHPGLLLLFCVFALFLYILFSAAAVVILFLPQDFFCIFTKEMFLGTVSAVILIAAMILADRRSRKVIIPFLCAQILSVAGAFFVVFRCGYYQILWKFILLCLVLEQVSVSFFFLIEVFPCKKIYYILFAGLVCLIFIKTIFL